MKLGRYLSVMCDRRYRARIRGGTAVVTEPDIAAVIGVMNERINHRPSRKLEIGVGASGQ